MWRYGSKNKLEGITKRTYVTFLNPNRLFLNLSN